MEETTLTDAEFKIMVIKITKEFRKKWMILVRP